MTRSKTNKCSSELATKKHTKTMPRPKPQLVRSTEDPPTSLEMDSPAQNEDSSGNPPKREIISRLRSRFTRIHISAKPGPGNERDSTPPSCGSELRVLGKGSDPDPTKRKIIKLAKRTPIQSALNTSAKPAVGESRDSTSSSGEIKPQAQSKRGANDGAGGRSDQIAGASPAKPSQPENDNIAVNAEASVSGTDAGRLSQTKTKFGRGGYADPPIPNQFGQPNGNKPGRKTTRMELLGSVIDRIGSGNVETSNGPVQLCVMVIQRLFKDAIDGKKYAMSLLLNEWRKLEALAEGPDPDEAARKALEGLLKLLPKDLPLYKELCKELGLGRTEVQPNNDNKENASPKNGEDDV